jgi:transposase-like protein
MTAKDVSDRDRERALELLIGGEATLSEVADLAGVSRQLVRHWAIQAGIDAPAERQKLLRKLWRQR